MTRQVTDQLYIDLDYYEPEEYLVYVAEAEVLGGLYIDAGYIDEGYYLGQQSEASSTCDLTLVVGEVKEFESTLFSEFTAVQTIDKIVGFAAGLNSEFTIPLAMLSDISGVDMFAFAEASIAIAVDRIRDNNSTLTSDFDIATDFVRIIQSDSDVDAAFIQATTPERSRDFDTAIEAAVSLDVTKTRVRDYTSDQTSKFDLFAVFSNVRGVDIIQQNFASLDCSADKTTESQIGLISDSEIVATIGYIVDNSSELSSVTQLLGLIKVLLRNTQVEVVDGGIYKSWQFSNDAKFNQSVTSSGLTPGALFDRSAWLHQGTLYKVLNDVTIITSNGVTVNTISTPGSVNSFVEKLNFTNNTWYNGGQYSTNLQNWQSIGRSVGASAISTRILTNNIVTDYRYVNGSWRLGAWINPNFDSNWIWQEWRNTGNTDGNADQRTSYNISNTGVIISFQGAAHRRTFSNQSGSFNAPSGLWFTRIRWDGNQTIVAHFNSNNFNNNAEFLGYSTNNGSSWTVTQLGSGSTSDPGNFLFRPTNLSYTNNRWFVTINNIRYSSTDASTLLSSPVDKITNDDLYNSRTNFNEVFYFNNAWRSYTGNTVRSSTNAVNWTDQDIAGTQNKNAVVTYTLNNADYRDWKTIDFWVKSVNEQGFDTHHNDFLKIVTDAGSLNLVIANRVDRFSSTVQSSKLGLRVVPTLNPDTAYYLSNPNNTTNLFQDQQWQHIRISRNGSNIAYYIDGQRVYTNNNFNPQYGNNAKIQLSTASNLRGNYDELLVTKELLINPSVTSFPVPTQPWENNDDTLLLLHFDGDFADDSQFIVDPEADLTATFTLGASLRADYDVTLGLNSEFIIVANIDVDRSADLVAFSEAALGVDATRIQQGEVFAESEATVVVDIDIVVSAEVVASALTELATDAVKTTENIIATESVATKLAIVVKVGDVVVDMPNNVIAVTVAEKITDIEGVFDSEFAQEVSGDKFVGFDAELTAEASVAAVIGQIFNQLAELVSVAGIALESQVTYQAQAELDSEFMAMADAAGGTIRAFVDLVSEFATAVTAEITRDNSVVAVSESAIVIDAVKTTDIESQQFGEFTQTSTEDRIRNNEIATDAIAVKIIVAVKNVTQDIEGTAEFTLSADTVKITDDNISLTADSNIAVDAVYTAHAVSDAAAEFTVHVEGTTNITGEIHATSEFELAIDADVTATIVLTAFAAATLSAEVAVTRGFDSTIESTATVNIVSDRIRFVDSAVDSTFTAEVEILRIVDSGELQFDSIATSLSLGRKLVVDMKVYIIPQETRQYIIAEETRQHRIGVETRIFAIRSTR